jgi:triphosphoribosyl-dephospho-CoA synthase
MTAQSRGERGDAARRRIGDAYRAACALELDALKPGNVHRASAGHGMTVADFLTSAAVSADPLTEPGLGLGERVYRAVAATRAAVGCNTNLGIILLCAPLIQAALDPAAPATLRARLLTVLCAADRRDMDGLNRAIRLAAPGGLGESAQHDVAAPATATPLAVMALAATVAAEVVEIPKLLKVFLPASHHGEIQSRGSTIAAREASRRIHSPLMRSVVRVQGWKVNVA